jgi:streptogramin lyase
VKKITSAVLTASFVLAGCAGDGGEATKEPAVGASTAAAALTPTPTAISQSTEQTEPPAAAPAVVAEFDLGVKGGAPVFAAGSAWVAGDGGQLARIDAKTNKSEVVLKGKGQHLSDAMSAFDSIWFHHPETRPLVRIDPSTGAVTASIPEAHGAAPAAVGFGSVWGMDVGHKVVRVDPNTNKVVARLRLSTNKVQTHGCVAPFRNTCPNYLTVHKDKVVVFIEGEDAAVHIDPATNRVTKRVPMPANAAGFYGVEGEVPWIMTESGLAQVDLDSGRVLARIPLGDDQRQLYLEANGPSIAINGDTAWLVADTITTEIDLKRAEVVKTFATPGNSGVVAASFGHGDLWVSYDFGIVRRLDVSAS